MMMELLPNICQLKILRFLNTPDIIACKSVSRVWRLMVKQWWSRAVTRLSIPGDLTRKTNSAVFEWKCQQILSNIERQLEGIQINLADHEFEPNYFENLLIWVANRFPALQSLCLRAPWEHFNAQLLCAFKNLRSLTLESCYGYEFSIAWDMVLPQLRFIEELNLGDADFKLTEDQIRAMPTDFFLSLKVLTFTDVVHESDKAICLFVKKCTNLQTFGFCGQKIENTSEEEFDWFVNITWIIDSLSPSIKILRVKNLNSDDEVYFREIMDRFPILEEAEIGEFCTITPECCEAILAHPPCSVTLRKLILTDVSYETRMTHIISVFAKAPVQLTHLEISLLWDTDEDIMSLIKNQNQLEVLKLTEGDSDSGSKSPEIVLKRNSDGVSEELAIFRNPNSIKGSFFQDLVLNHPKIKTVHFSDIIFGGLPEYLQVTVNILSNPSSIAGLAIENRSSPLELKFLNCSFTEEGNWHLSLSMNPSAAKYIHVTNMRD